MRKKMKGLFLSPIVGLAILIISGYFLVPNLLEIVWAKVPGTIATLEKSSLAENSKYRGTVESAWFTVTYNYTFLGVDHQGKDHLGGRSRYSLGNSPSVSANIELIVDPNNPSQSMVKRPVSQLSVFGTIAAIILILGPIAGHIYSVLSRRRLEKIISKSARSGLDGSHQ